MTIEGNELAKLEDLQDEALRAIGRNVLNFQKMEGMLKFIASSTGAIGSTRDAEQPIKDLERSIKNRKKAIKRLPMGRLAEALSKSLQPGQGDQADTVDSEDRISIKVSFTIGDEDFARDLALSLDRVVRERNDLIHTRLLRFDRTSKESCEALIRDLDSQRERMKPLYEALFAICSSLREAYQELEKYAKSEKLADDVVLANEMRGEMPSE